MTEAHGIVREGLPLWPRILAGILICPIVWLGLVRLVEAVLSTSFVPITVAGLLLIPEGQELTSPTIAKIKNHNLLTNVTQRLLVYS